MTEATKHAHRHAANTGIAAQWIFKTAHNQIADTQIKTQPCSVPEAPPLLLPPGHKLPLTKV